MQAGGIDYRTAYRVVGHAVREASAAGLRGVDVDGTLLDRAAVAVTGQPLGLAGRGSDAPARRPRGASPCVRTSSVTWSAPAPVPCS